MKLKNVFPTTRRQELALLWASLRLEISELVAAGLHACASYLRQKLAVVFTSWCLLRNSSR